MPSNANKELKLIQLGVEHRINGEYESAIKVYNSVITMNPNNSVAWHNLGNIYSDTNQSESAIRCYQKAIEIDPTVSLYWKNLGNLYLDVKDYERAKKHFKRSIEINPQDAENWNCLGMSQFFLQQYTNAIKSFGESIRIEPSKTTALRNLGMSYYITKKYDQAISYFERVLQIDPTYAKAWNSLGLTYMGLKRFNEAEESFQHAVKLNPFYHISWNDLGNCYQELKRFADAIECYEKALQIKSTYGIAELNLRKLQTKYPRIWKELRAKRSHAEKILKEFSGSHNSVKFDELIIETGLSKDQLINLIRSLILSQKINAKIEEDLILFQVEESHLKDNNMLKELTLLKSIQSDTSYLKDLIPENISVSLDKIEIMQKLDLFLDTPDKLTDQLNTYIKRIITSNWPDGKKDKWAKVMQEILEEWSQFEPKKWQKIVASLMKIVSEIPIGGEFSGLISIGIKNLFNWIKSRTHKI
jgi:tetratricopeptide (TPR) repeat protein